MTQDQALAAIETELQKALIAADIALQTVAQHRNNISADLLLKLDGMIRAGMDSIDDAEYLARTTRDKYQVSA